MLLTISTTHQPATDLGYLLHKHPERPQAFKLPFGEAQVFYTEATDEKCTAALVLDIDPITLKRRRATGFELEQYVNDRPYVASSFLSVAIARVYGSALRGQCEERTELADRSMPLQARISALPCRDGEQLIRNLFAPLGYAIDVRSHVLDEAFPEWGDSPYYTVSMQARLQPAVKCRGREYLRIIYGPEYSTSEHLKQLRHRNVKAKQSMALREFSLGLEGLERFVRGEPLRRVHECVFGVLALESEPVDPRL